MAYAKNLPITVAKCGRWKGHAKGEEIITPEVLRSIKEHFDRRGVEVPIDYEHESLENKKAPAIGWINALEIQGDELIAQPKWSEEARELIKNGAYRYVSPVFIFDAKDEQSGEKLPAVLHSVALTNTPFMAQLGEIKANSIQFTKGETMEKVDETLIDNAAKKPEKPTGVANSADKAEKIANSEDELRAQVSELAAENEALKSENAELKERIKELEEQLGENKKQAAKEAVENSIAVGKISEAQREWANSYAAKDLEGFKEFLATARGELELENNMFENSRKVRKAEPKERDAADVASSIIMKEYFNF